jgi:hypothetical protein
MSRCILKFIPGQVVTVEDVKIIGEGNCIRNFWKTITSENELRENPAKYKS